MKIQEIVAAALAMWALSLVTVAFGSARVTSPIDLLPLAIAGVCPPLALWFRLNDPSDTLGASVLRLREEKGGR